MSLQKQLKNVHESLAAVEAEREELKVKIEAAEAELVAVKADLEKAKADAESEKEKIKAELESEKLKAEEAAKQLEDEKNLLAQNSENEKAELEAKLSEAEQAKCDAEKAVEEKSKEVEAIKMALAEPGYVDAGAGGQAIEGLSGVSTPGADASPYPHIDEYLALQKSDPASATKYYRENEKAIKEENQAKFSS